LHGNHLSGSSRTDRELILHHPSSPSVFLVRSM
jgi:hypothetical protein